MATVGIKPLEDQDPMPWGQYKGTPLQDVPAAYLHFLWTNGMKDKLKGDPRSVQFRVADYIRRNLDALRKDHPDGIWT